VALIAALIVAVQRIERRLVERDGFCRPVTGSTPPE
jgi:hypothetical protein